jgi:hypothetical protein
MVMAGFRRGPFVKTTRTAILTAAGGKGLATAGAGDSQDPESRELGTNDVNFHYLAFDKDTEQHAWWNFAMPDSWDGGTIKATFHWTFASGSPGGVTWGIAGRSFGEGEAMDQALGTEIEVDDTATTADDLHISSQSAAVTLAGSPTGGEGVYLVVARKTADANDTHPADAQLLSVLIEYAVSGKPD